MTIALLLMTGILSAAEQAEYDTKKPLPQSSFSINKYRVNYPFTIVLSPLSVDYSGKEFFTVAAATDIEVQPSERIGFHVYGRKSYFSASTDMDSGASVDEKSNSYTAEGGISAAVYVKNSTNKVPVTLGSRYTGYNEVTTYYASCDLPTKTSYAFRAGYLRNSTTYKLATSVYGNSTKNFQNNVDSIYSGFEWNMNYDAEITISDKNVEKDFGKVFHEKFKANLYGDMIYAVKDSGSLEKTHPFGFRIGYKTSGYPWGVKLEGGINPSYGKYFLIDIGIAIF